MAKILFNPKKAAIIIFAQLGNAAKDLKNAEHIVQDCKQQLLDLNNELNYDEDSETSFRKALASVNVWNENVLELGEKLNSWQDYFDALAKMVHMQACIKVQDEVDDAHKLKALIGYIRYIDKLHHIGKKMQVAMDEKNIQELIDLYLKIYDPGDTTYCVLGVASVQGPADIYSYVMQVASIWYVRLKKCFSLELEKVMETIRINTKEDALCMKYDENNTEGLEKAQTMASLLFTLQPPNKDLNPLITITASLVCQPLSDVICVLLKPYKQRFQYHFMGSRKTNRLDKPEWMFTQILNWIKQSHQFMSEVFQPCAIESGNIDLNVRLEFMRGLMMLAMEKVAHDMEKVKRDNNLFGHLIDETLCFEAEMRELFGYPDSLPNVLHVFSQPQYLLKWISMEEDYCETSLDKILQDKEAWRLLDPMIIKDEFKIPVCVDRFVRLLDGIKQRYFDLIQPGKKVQFLAIQKELIDSFRRRLVQLYNCNLVSASSVLNAVNYLIMVLQDWGENVHYLHLNSSLIDSQSNEITTVFDEPLSELEEWQSSMMKTYAESLFIEIRSTALPYCYENWADVPEHSSKQPFLLTPSSGEMFQILLRTLHSLHDELSMPVFMNISRSIAKQLDSVLFMELIMSAKFSLECAEQFKFDMTRNLFPLFSVYINFPDLLLKKVNNAIKLLTAAKGTALLVHETLLSDDDEAKRDVLMDLGIDDFQIHYCIQVLERRVDINPNL